MIGYVLLISLAVVMGGIVYTWATTYIPKEDVGCDDGTSLILEKANCETILSESKILLNITLKNNGRFSVGGFLIRGTNDTEQTIATFDLSGGASSYIIGGGQWLMPGTKFPGTTNSFNPGYTSDTIQYSIPTSAVNAIELIEIIPLRWQEVNGKAKVLSCGDSKIREKISC